MPPGQTGTGRSIKKIPVLVKMILGPPLPASLGVSLWANSVEFVHGNSDLDVLPGNEFSIGLLPQNLWHKDFKTVENICTQNWFCVVGKEVFVRVRLKICKYIFFLWSHFTNMANTIVDSGSAFSRVITICFGGPGVLRGPQLRQCSALK